MNYYGYLCFEKKKMIEKRKQYINFIVIIKYWRDFVGLG